MESILDLFNDRAFHTTALTNAIQDIEYIPQYLGSLGLFKDKPIRGRSIAVEKKGQTLKLIETSPLGAAPRERLSDPRNMRDFRTTRLAESFTLKVVELEGLRAFGKAEALQQLQAEYGMRMQEVKNDMQLTDEHHALGALQGLLLDADGTSVIYDYFAEFGVTKQPTINFQLNTPTPGLRKKCHDLKRSIVRSAKGAFGAGAQIHALCGDDFFDAFVTHDEVERLYLNWAAAQDLKEGQAFGGFKFGEIVWHNYRGTDDNATVAIPTNQAKFFIKGGRDVFQRVLSPAEFDPWLHKLGKKNYALNIPDRDRGAWVKGELYSYPLYMCTRPQTIRDGVAS